MYREQRECMSCFSAFAYLILHYKPITAPGSAATCSTSSPPSAFFACWFLVLYPSRFSFFALFFNCFLSSKSIKTLVFRTAKTISCTTFKPFLYYELIASRRSDSILVESEHLVPIKTSRPFVATPLTCFCHARTSFLEVVPFPGAAWQRPLACPLDLTIFYSMLQGLPTATEHDHSRISARAPNRIPSANTSLPIGDYKM